MNHQHPSNSRMVGKTGIVKQILSSLHFLPPPIAQSNETAVGTEDQRRASRIPLRLITVLAILAALLTSLVASFVLAAPAADDGDVVADPMTIPRNSHSATLLADGRVLVAGGWDGSATLASADLYDPQARSWQTTGALNVARAFHAAARLPDGRVLVAGGWDNMSHVLTSTEVYEPAKGTWAPAAALQGARAGHVAVTLPDGRVLVAAGCADAGVRRDAELYDPKADAWQATGELAEGRCWPTATLLADGRVLVVGGRDPAGQARAGAELYDPIKNSWTLAARLTVPREGHTATLLPDGRVLIVGGYNGEYLASAEVYDPAKNTWTPTDSMSAARAYHAAALLKNGKVLIAGGSAGSRPSLDTETYHQQSGKWTPAGPLSAPYESHLATILDDGRVLITGRPDSGDRSGNGGYPVPTPAPGGADSPAGPAPWLQMFPPLPASAPRVKTNNTINQNAPDTFNSSEQITLIAETAYAAVQGSPAVSNFTTGTTTARLYSVYEASFTRSKPSTSGYNPYAITLTVTFIPELSDDAKNVMAFYDGPDPANSNNEIWKARVYVNHVGPWHWTAPTGFTPVGSTNFSVVVDSGSGLRGMLRVITETATITTTPSIGTPIGNMQVTESAMSRVGTPKRWYTDDGRTFLPMADTAYRLFFEVPVTSTPAIPASYCPTQTLTTSNADTFVGLYAADAVTHAVNVLRVLSLGTWAYTDAEIEARYECGPNGDQQCKRTDDCNADLSLFWSKDPNGSSHDLFDGAPKIDALHVVTEPYYPNLKSFQQTDRKLQKLLDDKPSLYIQLLLVPEPFFKKETSWAAAAGTTPDTFPDNVWLGTTGVNPDLKQQLWKTMIARWAAFPNVFWSISNDLADNAITNTFGDSAHPQNVALAQEVGSYVAGNDPWRQNRPLSFGHIRYREDSSRQQPWHTYITAYAGGDISAQQMDGQQTFGAIRPYSYALETKPTFDVEDWYESDGLAQPAYYYRRLFWSQLLSASGATYGDYATYEARQRYSTANLHGLDSITYTQKILDDAHVDLALFRPQDTGLITVTSSTGDAAWLDFDRAQVARRGSTEILAYIPNTDATSITDPLSEQSIKQATPKSTSVTVKVDMTEFTDPNYIVTWYRADTGAKPSPPTSVISGNLARLPYSTTVLSAPLEWAGGDVVLHISSRCSDPNHVCLTMDESPAAYLQGWKDNFLAITKRIVNGLELTATLNLDPQQRVFAGSTGASWRCDRPVGTAGDPRRDCKLYFVFSQAKSVATVDYYFRRNSKAGHQSVAFITAPTVSGPITTSLEGWPASGIDIGFDQEAMFSDRGEWGYPVTWNYVRKMSLAPNRWYHLAVKAQPKDQTDGSKSLEMKAFLDGVLVFTTTEKFAAGDQFLRGVVLHSAWWGPEGAWWMTGNPTPDLPAETTPSIWWDELSIDPPPDTDLQGLYKTAFQKGLGYYDGNQATWFDASAGYNNTSLLHVGANNVAKSLLRFDVSAIPANAVIDEAILQLYNTGRSNGNSLTLGAHGMMADWTDSQVNWPQRKTGVNWNVAGMGSGSDYTATAAATANLTGAGNTWVDLNITGLAQVWVSNPAANLGLVLTQEAASGYVTYDFCSELGWSLNTDGSPPCSPAQAPKLTLRYHLVPPLRVKTTFQRGINGYTGNQATWLDASGGYNYTTDLLVGENILAKSLLKFDIATIPITATVDEATLQLYQLGRSNGNSLTLGAHRVLAAWTDSQANWTQRQTGVNWGVAGMGSGSDYLAAADGTASLASVGGAWVDVNVKGMVQAWVTNPTQNQGLVLTQDAASGYVIYTFCSELGWAPSCSAALAPKLTIWYH